MTDTPPDAPAAPPAPARPIAWSNVTCIALAALTAIAELAAVCVFKADAAVVHGIGDPIVAVCCIAYDAKAAVR